jgi:acetate kinase
MGMATPLILVANPGSASRKYALFEGARLRASLHFEHADGRIICTILTDDTQKEVPVKLGELAKAPSLLAHLLHDHQVLANDEKIHRIGLRIVAPSSYFLEHRELDNEAAEALKAMHARAPLHVAATLQELEALREQFKDTPIIGASDSAFHKTKPDYAWNYGIPLEDADRLEIKRFGYHGLSVASAVHTLKHLGKLPPRLIITHLGSGVSITAVRGGRSQDTSMGYSPLEGAIMATRSGSIDVMAASALKEALDLNEEGLVAYLNQHSGLKGLGGTSDIRELLQHESQGDHRAALALQTFVYSIQKTIGQMSAALGGVDMLAFTGTVGERSNPIRERILENLHYLDLLLDKQTNNECISPTKPVIISRPAASKPIIVLPADEAAEIAKITQTF